MSDGRSRLSRRARKAAAELVEEAGVPTTAHQCRLLRDYGRFVALGEMTAARLGTDPKATLRRLTALDKRADEKRRAVLEALAGPGGGNGHRRNTASPDELVARAQAAIAAAGRAASGSDESAAADDDG